METSKTCRFLQLVSNEWRKTYIIAFRDSETIKKERLIGFTHSHNDKVDWEKVISI